jgi:hypothetical protein
MLCTAWGVIAMLNSQAKSFSDFCGLRFLLGFFEAGLVSVSPPPFSASKLFRSLLTTRLSCLHPASGYRSVGFSFFPTPVRVLPLTLIDRIPFFQYSLSHTGTGLRSVVHASPSSWPPLPWPTPLAVLLRTPSDTWRVFTASTPCASVFLSISHCYAYP